MKTLDRIKYLLDQKGWSMYRLAQSADMSQSTIANLFNRNYEPTIATLESICKGFGISLAEFFTDESEMQVFINAQQKELLDNWNRLDEKQKQSLLDLIKSM